MPKNQGSYQTPINLRKPQELFTLSIGNVVANLNILIRDSQEEGDEMWDDEKYQISQTYQRGINPIGLIQNRDLTLLKGVIAKVTHPHEGINQWNSNKTIYTYALQKYRGEVKQHFLSNQSLIQQSIHKYPILLFIKSEEIKGHFVFNGQFKVSSIYNNRAELILLPENKWTKITE